jgi:effector-binding domain-containing protein
MNSQAQPDYLISQMRVLDMNAITFFYVTNQPTEFGNLDRDLDVLLSSLAEARAQACITDAGPDIVRYYPAGESGLYLMEVGVPVRPGTQTTEQALVKDLPAYHCASVLLWGGLAPHIGQTYETLTQAIQEAGLVRSGECREMTYYFESVDSPNNLMGVYMGIH